MWIAPFAPNDTADRLVALYREIAAEIDGVEFVHVGRPRRSDRDVVDDSWTVSAITVFESPEAESAWQTHPRHAELRDQFQEFIARTVIYDAIE